MSAIKLCSSLFLLLPALLQGQGTSTSTVLTSSLDPSVLGQSVTLTATVTPATAGGSVTFYDGATVLEILPLSGGRTSFTTTLLGSGAHSLKAFYPGDHVTFAPSSAHAVQTVVPSPSNGFVISETVMSGFFNSDSPGPAAVGDFNGDGKPDLALASYGPGTIYLGQGDGTFQPGFVFSAAPVAFSPFSPGDFNGDGKTDLAVAESGGISVLLGKGDGTFLPGVTIPVTGFIQSVIPADFNGDGIVDLAVSETTPGIVILRGNGDGTFQSPVSYPGTSYENLGYPPRIFLVDDFDGDGLPDLGFVANQPGTNVLTILLNNGNGFQAPLESSYPGAFQLAAGDLNGDGKLDIVLVSEDMVNQDFFFSVLLGNGKGAFEQPATSYGHIGFRDGVLAVADMNGDGLPDVVWANNFQVQVLLGNGDGSLRNPITYGFPAQSGEPTNIVFVDFNRDGLLDFATENSVLLGVPLGAGNTTITLTAAKNPVVLGDNMVLTARVSPAKATGAVTFYDGSAVKGTVVLSGGTASLTISNATVGSHALKAVYGGGPGENPSDSAILTEVVIPALTPGAPVPNPLTSNVLTNPGAESGMTGWWPSSTVSMAVAESPHTGSHSFLGAHVPSAFITQTLQLAQVAGITLAQVDSGNLAANYSFWFTDLSPGSGAHGEITMTFEDANGTILGQGVSSSLRNNTNQTWLNGTGSFPIPPGARIVNYTMDFLTSSSGNTGLMDDNVFTISPVNQR